MYICIYTYVYKYIDIYVYLYMYIFTFSPFCVNPQKDHKIEDYRNSLKPTSH